MNSGTTTVEIESVQSSCGCTIPTLAKTLYAPGERGEVLARFNIGELRGVNTKTIRVAVKGEREPAELTWVVNIPELVRISPSPVVWDQNDDTRSKTISLNALPEQPVRVTNVTSTNPFFSAAVETVEEGKRYEITVTRQDIDTPGFALLTIDALVLEKKRTFQVFVQIRPKTKSTPVAR